MKKLYQKPTMLTEEFHANEYIGTCTETVKVFKCDGGFYGTLTYYKKSNGDGVLTEEERNGGTANIKGYGACEFYEEIGDHNVDIADIDVYYDGYYTPSTNMDDAADVIIYHEKSIGHWHATRNLDVTSWESTRS